eukprot:1817460-Prymnesium_polylepis.1
MATTDATWRRRSRAVRACATESIRTRHVELAINMRLQPPTVRTFHWTASPCWPWPTGERLFPLGRRRRVPVCGPSVGNHGAMYAARVSSILCVGGGCHGVASRVVLRGGHAGGAPRGARGGGAFVRVMGEPWDDDMAE